MSHIVVAFLLASPFPIPLPRHASPALWDALKGSASRSELAGPSCRWIDDFRSEVHWVRARASEARSWPFLADVDRLPPEGVARANHEYWQHRESYFEAQRWFVDPAELKLVLGWVRPQRQTWSAISTARDKNASWLERRHALARLRDLVGPRAYYAGQWYVE